MNLALAAATTARTLFGVAFVAFTAKSEMPQAQRQSKF